jgi:hypothetical protein
MRWHDVPVAALLAGGNDYDISVDWTATTSGFQYWYNPTISQPWNAYGMMSVVVGEFGGIPDPANEFIQMRVNSCLGEAATGIGPRNATPAFSLHAPYPNPASGTATIDFTLDTESKVSMNVYDVAGRRVATLINNEVHPAGLNTVSLNTRQMPTGIYFVKMQTPVKSVTRKITVVR